VGLSRPRVRNATDPTSHGLDEQYAALPTGDPFSDAFASSAAKLRALDAQNAALQKQCRSFLASSSSALLGVDQTGLLAGTASGAGSGPSGIGRPLPAVMPLPWAVPRQVKLRPYK